MINVLICDDDKATVNKVYNLLKTYQSNTNTTLNIDCIINAENIDENAQYDIAVLDIEMPNKDGLILSEMLMKNNPDTLVIILTSFPDYLDSAMKIHVFRYLSKPIDKNRFFANFNDAVQTYKNISKKIIIDHQGKISTVRTKDILYIENKKHGSLIATKNGILSTNKKPEQWKEIINQPDCFVQSHKSFIVNLQNVINFDKTAVEFRKGNDIIKLECISQRKYSQFKKAFFEFAGGMI